MMVDDGTPSALPAARASSSHLQYRIGCPTDDVTKDPKSDSIKSIAFPLSTVHTHRRPTILTMTILL